MAVKHPGIYTCITPECEDSLVEALNGLLSNDLNGYNPVARDYALENFSKTNVIDRFISQLSEKYLL